jgi:hypothetical protein
MTSLTKIELWVENRQFYQELVEKYRWSLEPMIELIDELGKLGFHEKFYPSNSHEALGLSTVQEFSQRCERHMVYIVYRQITDKFEVHYQSGPGNLERKETCDRKEIFSKFKEIESWLVSLPK